MMDRMDVISQRQYVLAVSQLIQELEPIARHEKEPPDMVRPLMLTFERLEGLNFRLNLATVAAQDVTVRRADSEAAREAVRLLTALNAFRGWLLSLPRHQVEPMYWTITVMMLGALYSLPDELVEGGRDAPPKAG